MTTTVPPFTKIFTPTSEVRLDKAPLINVIAQIKFSTILDIQTNQQKISSFQALLKDFPFFIKEEYKIGKIDLTKQLIQQSDSAIYRFTNVRQSMRVSVGPDFLALETS